MVLSVSRVPEEGRPQPENTHPEELLIEHMRHIECAQGIDVHHGLEGIEGQCAGWAQEVSSCTCRMEEDMDVAEALGS